MGESLLRENQKGVNMRNSRICRWCNGPIDHTQDRRHRCDNCPPPKRKHLNDKRKITRIFRMRL